jgi:hypothetical protein
VHTQDAVHLLACELRPVDRIDRLHDHGYARKAAVHVGAGQELFTALDLALPVLDGLGAQHQVREVQVPRMRRRVRALGHVAQVAQVALVDDLPVRFLGDAVHLAVLGLVDEVEQVREALAQADAAAAAVADVEDTLHLLHRRGLVVELGVLPVQRVPGRGFEVAFAHGGSVRVRRNENKGQRAPCSVADRAVQSTRASSAFW